MTTTWLCRRVHHQGLSCSPPVFMSSQPSLYCAFLPTIRTNFPTYISPYAHSTYPRRATGNRTFSLLLWVSAIDRTCLRQNGDPLGPPIEQGKAERSMTSRRARMDSVTLISRTHRYQVRHNISGATVYSILQQDLLNPRKSQEPTARHVRWAGQGIKHTTYSHDSSRTYTKNPDYHPHVLISAEKFQKYLVSPPSRNHPRIIPKQRDSTCRWHLEKTSQLHNLKRGQVLTHGLSWEFARALKHSAASLAQEGHI